MRRKGESGVNFECCPAAGLNVFKTKTGFCFFKTGKFPVDPPNPVPSFFTSLMSIRIFLLKQDNFVSQLHFSDIVVIKNHY